MAITYIPFQPNAQQAPTFQVTLTDLAGNTAAYNVIITWLYGAGFRGGACWYVNLYDQSGTWIFTLPLIGSPPEYNISMTAGYFATSLVYRTGTMQFEVGA